MVSDRDAWNRWDECLTIAVEKIDPKIGESMPFRFSDFSDDWAGLLVESYTAEAETLISVGVIFFFLDFPVLAQYELGTTGFRKIVEASITSHDITVSLLYHVISMSQWRNIDDKI